MRLQFGLVARSRPARGEKTDRGSMAFIMLAGGIGMVEAFVSAGIQAFRITRGQKAWFVAGLLLLLSGSLLRRHCWRMLGKHFTRDVKASPDQPFVSGAFTAGYGILPTRAGCSCTLVPASP